MPAFKLYDKPTVGAPFQTSPFKPGDRVKTLKGTGTIYQSGPYNSWVVLDSTWNVQYVRTEFVARTPGRIEGARPGYPTVAQLDAAGYEVALLNDDWLTLADALDQADLCQDLPVRIVSSGVHYNEYALVEYQREEPEPYKPVGLGGLV